MTQNNKESVVIERLGFNTTFKIDYVQKESLLVLHFIPRTDTPMMCSVSMNGMNYDEINKMADALYRLAKNVRIAALND